MHIMSVYRLREEVVVVPGEPVTVRGAEKLGMKHRCIRSAPCVAVMWIDLFVSHDFILNKTALISFVKLKNYLCLLKWL